jgi:uncharacterized membrane protein
MIEKEKESMKRRAIAAAGAAAVGAAAAVVALVAGTTVGFAETSTSSAYGVAAEGVLEIEPVPYVESSDGSTKTDSLVELPENPLLNVAVAKVSAGDGQASVKLADVSVLPANVQLPKNLKDLQKAVDQLRGLLAKPCDASKPKLPEKLPKNPLTDLVVELTKKLDPKPLCDVIKGRLSVLELGLVEVYCDGDQGGLKIADVKLLGHKIELPEAPENVGLPENPLLQLTINKQVADDEDGSFSVTGLELNLLDGTQVIKLGNATCGVTDVDDGDEDDQTPPTATKPAPVTTKLPVTG